MKKLLFGLIALFPLCTALAQNGYTVKVKIPNLNNYVMYLAYPSSGKYVMTTEFTTENGWAVFHGHVDEPVVASLGFRGNPESMVKAGLGVIPGPSLNFFLTNDVIQIVGDVNTVYMAKVSGGKANAEWNEIKAKQNELTHQNWMITKETYKKLNETNDSSVIKTGSEKRSANSEKDKKLQVDFIKRHPASVVSVYFLSNLVNDLSLPELKSSFARLGNEYKTTSYGQRIQEKIQNMEATAIGQQAIPIDKVDVNGNPVNLSTLQGKYVLLDFWGSWCAPCRAAFPHLKELYAKYKNQGFEILGIAHEQRDKLEDNKKIWKETIAEDKLPWLQVLNNEGMDKFNAVKAYGVTAFPTQILLDKEGKIIARYVGESKDLDEKLKEVFGK